MGIGYKGFPHIPNQLLSEKNSRQLKNPVAWSFLIYVIDSNFTCLFVATFRIQLFQKETITVGIYKQFLKSPVYQKMKKWILLFNLFFIASGSTVTGYTESQNDIGVTDTGYAYVTILSSEDFLLPAKVVCEYFLN